jgi:SAM-dependent methyltransferase
MPAAGYGIEIGAGSGRFAKPLGIEVGIEPSPSMRTLARERGIKAIGGIAEKLPLKPETFDYALFVTTVCFLDSLSQAFSETFRILKPQGLAVIGFIEKESPLGRTYQLRKAESRFYREASFHTADEIMRELKTAGFTDFSLVQTLFPEEEGAGAALVVKEGHGDGAFVVVRAKKPGSL